MIDDILVLKCYGNTYGHVFKIDSYYNILMVKYIMALQFMQLMCVSKNIKVQLRNRFNREKPAASH